MHGSDLVNPFFLGQELRDYVILFAVTSDPNSKGFLGFKWPKYTTPGPKQLVFLDGLVPQIVGKNTYRKEQMNTYVSVLLLNDFTIFHVASEYKKECDNLYRCGKANMPLAFTNFESSPSNIQTKCEGQVTLARGKLSDSRRLQYKRNL
jgi:hypothetical protein